MLAVVWVGSMKVNMAMIVWPERLLVAERGVVGLRRFIIADDESGPLASFQVNHRWQAWWWFRESNNLTFSSGVPWSYNMVGFAPLWPFILLTGVPGVWMLTKSRRAKGVGANLCPTCSYDLTGLPATPHGPTVCPECGKD
jgi:hypothetical protein